MSISRFGGIHYYGTGTSLYNYLSTRRNTYDRLQKTNYGLSSSVSGSRYTGYSTASKKINQYYKLGSSAESLNSSAAKLADTGNNDIFKKTVTKNDDGTITSEYDKEAIRHAVSNFVEDYNDTFEASKTSNNSIVINARANMASYTSAMKKKLASVGITVAKTGKLEIDEDTFKSSDMDSVKALFNGTQSYAKRIASSASRVYNTVDNLISSSANGLYSRAGSYMNAYSYLGSMFNSYF